MRNKGILLSDIIVPLLQDQLNVMVAHKLDLC